MAWNSGQELQGGKYIIDRILGWGGAGITYLARQHPTRPNEEWVVIKTLKDELRLDPKWANYQTRLQQDFLNEALKLARCRHPHVVQVRELIREETPEGTVDGMVMEYVQGMSLAERLGRGKLPEAEALHYIRQVGEALSIVHSLELLHRDVKPQNIMIRTGTSEAVLIDFGLAREFIPGLTLTHTESRTEGFSPIEQYDRRAKRGAYTDVYALAATLYCLLTGVVPRPAPSRLVGTPLEPPQHYNSAISDYVNSAILKGMALRAVDRPQSMQAWLILLEEPIARPMALARNPFSQSAYSVPNHPFTIVPSPMPLIPSVSTTANRSRRATRLGASVRSQATSQLPAPTTPSPSVLATIPWQWLSFALTGYAVLGISLTTSVAETGPSAWTGAWAGALAGASVGAGAETLSGALTVAVLVAVAVAAAGTLTGSLSGAWAGALAWAWAGIGALTLAGAGEKLRTSLSRVQTFFVLTGTSLVGLGWGWFVGMMWRSFSS
ncbi:serine/threonine protein kinase [Thermocoleostomius sinensis]|uniref:Serine/threonine-protein kinase n=1 Tax=Thermocoleostomius sinensis A174 TaxID=2016057 RepID=A0A9E8ZKX5_9CYAN|nr:serine/threonine-protein kinase [Thermocoleostomius sinensis]WAL60386.1 serine/threonine-protein kinase [Thermocoleostomius sinensis A174]